MEIIVSAPLDEFNDAIEPSAMQELERILKDFDSDVAITERNIGHGADWPVLLVTFGGIFLLGEKIQKNLDAWIAIAQRVISLFASVKAKFGLARVDESGAIAIAITDLINRSTAISSLILESCQLIGFTPVPWNPSKRLDGSPDVLYIVTFRVNGDSVYVYGIKSKGEIVFMHSYLTEWLEF
jgi:hypothetical protein